MWPDAITDVTAVDTCFEGTLLWTIEKLGGPDPEDPTLYDGVDNDSTITVTSYTAAVEDDPDTTEDETAAEVETRAKINFDTPIENESDPALYFKIKACQPNEEYALTNPNRCVKKQILITTDCGICEGDEPCMLCEADDEYCEMGSCGDMACTSTADCPKTEHCGVEGVCAFCSNDADPCLGLFSCQSATEGHCEANICDNPEENTCDSDFEFCVRGKCEEIPCSSNTECTAA